METSEDTADMIWQAMDERYGGAKEIAKTMTEDPAGIASDLAFFIEA